jgi:PTS system mannose-specific IID component
VLIRSFFIQGSWNFKGMQNIGFCYAISPVIDEVAGDKKVKKQALTRHTELFNTHPYMASTILGAVAEMELESKGRDSEIIDEMKMTLSGPFAAIGDTFFWSTLKPLFSITAITAAFLGNIFAPIIFLLLYNSFHIWMRVKGFNEGVKRKAGVIAFIYGLRLPVTSKKLKSFCFILLGVMISGLAYFFTPDLFFERFGGLRFLLIVPVLLMAYLIHKRVHLILQIYVISALIIAGFLIFG